MHLSQFDLFHAHLFLVPSETDVTAALPCTVVQDAAPTPGRGLSAGGGLGLLFHAKEYPRYCPSTFPYSLGLCQLGSTLEVDQRAMDTRNLVYYQVSPFDHGALG